MDHLLGDHPLDRPIWSALATRQAGLSQGDARALRFAPDYGVFAAAADRSDASLVALAALVPADGQVALVEAATPAAVPGTMIVSTAVIWQMVAPAVAQRPEPDFAIVDLIEADAPQMLALATETRPGPFFARTHQLGDFVGVKAGGRLIAMAGERMKPEGYTEVSGVCTDPNHRGRGYAGALMRVVANRILARGEIPFLHSYAHNTGAIGLYRSLGFALRSEMTMQVLERAEADRASA
jgi:predicted GNAT family acetyltransferase